MDKIIFEQNRIGYFNLDYKIRMNNLVINIFYMTFEKGWPDRHVPIHCDDLWGLHYISYGKGLIRTKEREYILTPGTFLFMPPRMMNELQCDRNDPMGEYFIYFDVELLDKTKTLKTDQFLTEETNGFIRCYMGSSPQIGLDTSCTLMLFEELINEFEKQEIYHYSKCFTILLHIFANAARAFTVEKSAKGDLYHNFSKEKRKIIIKAAFEDYYQTITKEQMSKKLSVGPRQVERIFKEYFNCTFSQRLLKFRIEKAKEILMENNKSIIETSYITGFTNPAYFSQVFKKNVGISPNEYKKSEFKEKSYDKNENP